MKAAVFHKPHDVRVEDVPDPEIRAARDAIVRVTATAICGSDLHIWNGFFPQDRPLVLGHEFVGVVEAVGDSVTNLRRGDRVVVPFPIACGGCWFCERGWPTQCESSNPENYGPDSSPSETGGGLFGYTDLMGGYAGGQAELVRVPYADFGPRKVPEDLTDEQVLFLSDIFPTGWCAVDFAQVRQGDTVAVFGCGPVGLMAQKAAWLKGASQVIGVDLVPERLEMARRAAHSTTIDLSIQDAVERIRDLTDGRGADACIDAVGMEAHRGLREKISNAIHLQGGTIAALELCIRSVRRGGRIGVVGVYAGAYASFPLGALVDKGIALRAGQALVHHHLDALLELVRAKEVVLDDIITHRLPLKDAPHAYRIFNEKEDGCVKVVLKP